MKLCKVCKTKFTSMLSTARVCSPICAMKFARASRDKAEKTAQVKERREDKVKREKIKSRADWAREAQAIANRYARIRDANDGCISCDKPANWHGQWHGSHFRSVGAASAVRFNLCNIHKACSVCNHHLSGNISGYTPKIIAKIGFDKVDWLLSQNQITSYTVEYLKKYKKVIGKRLKRMEKNKQSFC